MRKMLKKWNEISLVKRIICGLTIGIILGLTVPQLTVISLLGDLFVGALRAVVPLLVLFLVMSLAWIGTPTPYRFLWDPPSTWAAPLSRSLS